MGLTFKDLQDRVAEDATRSEGGTLFDSRIKEVINSSLFRVSRDSNWRTLRREDTFDTVTTYDEGSGAGTFTEDSKDITVVGATFITDNIKIGRRISLQGSSSNYKIATITGETTLTLDRVYDGTTIAGTGTYSILAQEEYNLPAQATHRIFLWHEENGNPSMLQYLTEKDAIACGIDLTSESTPTHYRMWNQNMVIDQLFEASVITISSSAAADTSVPVTIFGMVSGYPDYEVILTDSSDGTTDSAGSKSFTSVERVVKGASSTGRITATANTGNATIAVMPVGDTTAGINYAKVKLYPLPNSVFPINVYYYKDPFRLVNDSDVHELGAQFDEAIALLAVAKIQYASSKDDGDKFMALYQDEVRSLRKHNVDKMDWFPTLRGRNWGSGDIMVHPQLSARQVGAYFGTRA